MSVGGVLFVSAVVFLLWYVNNRQKQVALEDLKAANNCCFEWGNCGDDLAAWEAGWGACQRGECSSCPISGSSGDCDGDGKCEAGEDNKWCSSDCNADGTDTGSESETEVTSGTWNQCDASASNLPCGSCSISLGGAGVVNFSCELKCTTGDCPSSSSSIAHRWERCGNAGSTSCNESDSDYIASGNLGGDGPWSISAQTDNQSGVGTYSVPDCGRIQLDVQMNNGTNVAGVVYSSGVDCEETTTTTTITTTTTTEESDPSCTITSTAVCIDEDTINIEWDTTLSDYTFDDDEDFVRLRFNDTSDVWYTSGTDIRDDVAQLDGSKNIDIESNTEYRVNAEFIQTDTALCESPVQTLECLTTDSSCSESCTDDTDCVDGLICSSGMCRNEDCTDETDCICDSTVIAEDPTTPTSESVPQTGLFDDTKGRLKLGFIFIIIGGGLILLDSLGLLQVRVEGVRDRFERKLK